MAMNISSIYIVFYQNYKVPEIKKVELEELNDLHDLTIDRYEPSPTNEIEQRNKIDIHDISLTFNEMESFDFLGKDSSLASLDMEKILSDMKKDEVIAEYQVYVGSARADQFELQSGDGRVIQK